MISVSDADQAANSNIFSKNSTKKMNTLTPTACIHPIAAGPPTRGVHQQEQTCTATINGQSTTTYTKFAMRSSTVSTILIRLIS